MKNLERKSCVIFLKKNYNFNKQLVCNALSNRYREHCNKEFMCKPCHMKLKEEKIKPKSGDIVEMNEVKTCFFCGNIPWKTFDVFEIEKYRNSNFVQQIEFNKTLIEKHSIICITCYNSLLYECIVKCTVCDKEVQRKIIYVYDSKKYKIYSENNPKKWMTKQHRIRDIYAWNVTHKLNPNFNVFHAIYMLLCTCANITTWMTITSNNMLFQDVCNMQVMKKMTQNTYVYHVIKLWKKTDYENPVVPYNINDKCLHAAAKFMKSLLERPEYVCTCYHHVLFRKTLKVFNIEEYEMDNPIVKKCLSYRSWWSHVWIYQQIHQCITSLHYW